MLYTLNIYITTQQCLCDCVLSESMPYHVNVPSPEEEDMSYYDETKELVKLLGAPFMNPGA